MSEFEINNNEPTAVEKISKSELKQAKDEIEAEQPTIADPLIEAIDKLSDEEVDKFILALKPVLKSILDEHNKKI